jgi:hypothetical protein
MLKVALDILQQNKSLLHLFHSIILTISRVAMLYDWQKFFEANLFLFKMIKDKGNISQILFLNYILSSGTLAHMHVDYGNSFP